MAINTLGNLGDQRGYAEIEKLLTKPDPVLSSWAWRALLRIDVDSTIQKHLPLIAVRHDWSPIFIAKVLLEINPDILSKQLCSIVENSFAEGVEERQLSRVVSYLIFAHAADYSVLLRRILLETTQKEVLIACLRLVNSDDDLGRVRELINDERWEVRLQVAMTLGRLAHVEDIETLIAALDDPDWWVRYRTASVLISMPGMTDEKIDELINTLPNKFARDIVLQVRTEMQLLCFRQTSLTLSR